MSHKKSQSKPNVNIEKALLKLSFPVKNNIGIDVNLKIKESKHSASKHISKRYHGLTEKDIELIPDILSNPFYVVRDPLHKEKKNYYGRRKGRKILFLKIVTKIVDEKSEEIITIFTTNKIKRWLNWIRYLQ